MLTKTYIFIKIFKREYIGNLLKINPCFGQTTLKYILSFYTQKSLQKLLLIALLPRNAV